MVANIKNLYFSRAPSRFQHRSSSVLRSASADQRRYRSASVTTKPMLSSDSHVRFNPTTYIHERNLKLKQIELQKYIVSLY